MRTSIKILGGLAVAGLISATGTAFTAGGLTSTAPADQFIGGSVSQTVSGAVLTGTEYVLTGNNITGINLEFDNKAIAKTLVVTLNSTTYTCTAGITEVAGTPTTGAAACVADPGVLSTLATSLTVSVTEP